MNTGKY